MAQNDTVCMTLAFNKKIRQSHREKVKEFWNFLDAETTLEPHKGKKIEKSPDETEDEDEEFPTIAKNKWFDQLQVFQDYKLDKAAFAATKTCKLCDEDIKHRSTEFADTIKESYDQLLNDIKIYDEKLRSKVEIGTGQDKRKSFIS